MRLLEKEKKTIVENIRKLDATAEIFLYGSRTQDNLLGGDIDLLVFSKKLGLKEKISILASIKKTIGDQKIDLKICDPNKKNAFVNKILTEAIRID